VKEISVSEGQRVAPGAVAAGSECGRDLVTVCSGDVNIDVI
jgi:hypothetical protein